ncbi:hypothetical protein BJ684DRAFT_18727 [Piptocephalis cylindrospora]|uniref:Uncharacterized protein n=1 Tax=Piptocephalis cylindrospora TaxID=1907219 RepID=A0A4P9Y7A5_9FUNG|nr:hypothetical protein BJ684DRAFT_18727 [Piptocephalis cylindrospora]|eukprot:RKP14893.1 hypothetical protein BJ684DRAFT_18727 [Piptocephalis cylindrospora]
MVLLAVWVLCHGQGSSISIPGSLLGLLLALSLTLQQAYVPVALQGAEGDVMSLVYHTCISSILLILPGYLIVSHELADILGHVYFLGNPTFWFLILLHATNALILLLASYHQIISTSPTTHAFSSTSRLALQPLITSLLLSASSVSFASGLFILLLVLGGNYCYSKSG